MTALRNFFSKCLTFFILVNLVSCEQGENMQSGLGELSVDKEQARRNVMANQKDFYDSIVENGLTETLDSVVSADPSIACEPTHMNVAPVSLSGNLDEIIDGAYKNDESCRKVFTGNGGNYDDVKLSYVRTFAYSMAQDICSGEEEGNLSSIFQQPSLGNKDALSLSQFNGGSTSEKSLDNMVSTYALTFTLAQRESSGNFSEGRDMSANNSQALTEEAGAIQVSANSLNLKGPTKETEFALRKIFKKYVDDLSGKSQQDQSVLCLNDKLSGPNESKNFDVTGGNLNRLFEKGDCSGLKSKMEDVGYGISEKVAGCFRNLNKECPGFSIKYGAAVARIRRNHNGPLILHQEFKSNVDKKYLKPYLKPACHSLFKSIAENKDKICADMNLKPSEKPENGSSPSGISVGSSGQNQEQNLGDFYDSTGGLAGPSAMGSAPSGQASAYERSDSDDSQDSIAPSAGLKELSVKTRLDFMSTQGQNSCAKGVRQTLNSLFGKPADYGDSTYKNGVASAKQYDERVLSQWETAESKYKKVSSLDVNGSFKNYDIRVLQPTGTCQYDAVNKHGHIEFFYNGQWYSDYKQNGSSYDNDKLRSPRCYASQSVYRLSPKN